MEFLSMWRAGRSAGVAVCSALACVGLGLGAAQAQAQAQPPEVQPRGGEAGPFVNFETIPTKALALSEDGSRLFVTNTPDGRLEIFDVANDGRLQPAGSVTVGLDPVAVAARSEREVWVVNLLSDSVSVVDVSSSPARVVNTLFVGDEPRDVVFAGPDRSRAFITAARRGQNHPDNVVDETQLPGTPRADVWVFDANDLGTRAGGEPLSIVSLFADKPGAMTVSEDGSRVFVAIATSGNDTSVISQGAVRRQAQNGPVINLRNGRSVPGGNPEPSMSQTGVAGPGTGQIVQLDRATGQWLDQAGRDWSGAVPFELADNDVFEIDAMANPPRETRSFQGIGTLNKNLTMAGDGSLFVSTIEAVNLNRFLSVPSMGAFPNPNPAAGVAQTADPATGRTLNGHLYESRVTIVRPNGDVLIRHLNKHIDYEVVPSPAGVKERSVADPQDMRISPDGETLFVSGFGSNSVVTYDVQEILDDSFEPDAGDHIRLSGDGGPTNIVLTPDGSRMFAYKRFDNAVATIDLDQRREVAVTELFNPEPDVVRVGRKFFYDANLGSSNGEANCNVCHPAADKDDLAWNLGTPFAGTTPNNVPAILFLGQGTPFNPLKGPMTVLTLRGIKDSGPMFWRGGATSPNPRDERQNFQNFNLVFEALLGRDGQLPQSDFDALTNWVLTLIPPPNPYAPLDGRLTENQAAGRNIFLGGEGPTDGPFNCNTCHGLNPERGFYATRGEQSVEGETQMFKITQLRTAYDKIGMFGNTLGTNGDGRTFGGIRTRDTLGPQVRGTGTLHDGSAAGVEEFLTGGVFQLDRRQLQQVTDFVYAFPSNVAPVVGQQVTLRADSDASVGDRIDLLQERAAASFVSPSGSTRECDLVAKAVVDGREQGFLFNPEGANFRTDRGQNVTPDQVRALASTPGQEVTFTCIYPGGGIRFGLDRDLNGTLDGQGS